MTAQPHLEYYGGSGVESVTDDEVKYGGGKNMIRVFVSLKEAKRFYDSMNHDKALWSTTTAHADLLECHTLEP